MSEIEIGSGGLRRLTINTGTSQGLDPTKILAGDGISVARDLVASTATVSIDHSYPNEFLDGQSAVPGPYHGWGWKGTSSSTPSAGVMGVGLAGGCFGVEAHSYGDAVPLLARVGLTVPPAPFGVLSLTGPGGPKVAVLMERSEADAGDGVRLLARNTLSDSSVSASSGAIDFKLSPNTVAGQSGYVQTLVNQGGALVEKFRVTESGAAVVSGENSPSYLNWDWTQGESGYGFRNYWGTLQYKNLDGAWAPFGSSSGDGWMDDTAVPDAPAHAVAKWVGPDRLLFSSANHPLGGIRKNQNIVDQEIQVARDQGFSRVVYSARVGPQLEHEIPISGIEPSEYFLRPDSEFGTGVLRPDEWPTVKAFGTATSLTATTLSDSSVTDFPTLGVAVGDSVLVWCEVSPGLPDYTTYQMLEVGSVSGGTIGFTWGYPASKLALVNARAVSYRVGTLSWASCLRDYEGTGYGEYGDFSWPSIGAYPGFVSIHPDLLGSNLPWVMTYQPEAETTDYAVGLDFEDVSPYSDGHAAGLLRGRQDHTTGDIYYLASPVGAKTVNEYIGLCGAWIEKQGLNVPDLIPQVPVGGFQSLHCVPEANLTADVASEAGPTAVAVDDCSGFEPSWYSDFSGGDIYYTSGGVTVLAGLDSGSVAGTIQAGDVISVDSGKWKGAVTSVDASADTAYVRMWCRNQGEALTQLPPTGTSFSVERDRYAILRQWVSGVAVKHEISLITAVSATSGAGTVTISSRPSATRKAFFYADLSNQDRGATLGGLYIPEYGRRHFSQFHAYELGSGQTWLQLRVDGAVRADWVDTPHAPYARLATSAFGPHPSSSPEWATYSGVSMITVNQDFSGSLVKHGDIAICEGTLGMVTDIQGTTVFIVPSVNVPFSCQSGQTVWFCNHAMAWPGQFGYGAFEYLDGVGIPTDSAGSIRVYGCTLKYRTSPASDLYVRARRRNNVGWSDWGEAYEVDKSAAPPPPLVAYNSLVGSHCVYWYEDISPDTSAYYLRAFDAARGGNQVYEVQCPRGQTSFMMPADGTHTTLYWEIASITPSGWGLYSPERTATTATPPPSGDGYWTRTGTAIHPVTITNRVAIGATSTSPVYGGVTYGLDSTLFVSSQDYESGVLGMVDGVDDFPGRVGVYGLVPKELRYPTSVVGVHWGGGSGGGFRSAQRTDSFAGRQDPPAITLGSYKSDDAGSTHSAAAAGDGASMEWVMTYASDAVSGQPVPYSGRLSMALLDYGPWATTRTSEFRIYTLAGAGRQGVTASFANSGTDSVNSSLVTLHGSGGYNQLKSESGLYIRSSTAVQVVAPGLDLTANESGSGLGVYQRIRANPAIASAQTFTLPSGYGTSGQSLITDGTGALSWSTISGGGAGGWTDDGTTVRLTTYTDKVSVGADTGLTAGPGGQPKLSLFPSSACGLGIDCNSISGGNFPVYFYKSTSYVGLYYNGSAVNLDMGVYAKKITLGTSSTPGNGVTNPCYTFLDGATAGMGHDSTVGGPSFYSQNVKVALFKSSASSSYLNLLHASSGATQTNYLGSYASDGTTACRLQFATGRIIVPLGTSSAVSISGAGAVAESYGLYFPTYESLAFQAGSQQVWKIEYSGSDAYMTLRRASDGTSGNYNLIQSYGSTNVIRGLRFTASFIDVYNGGSGSEAIKIAGTQVVGPRGATVSDPSGGTTVDSQARTAIIAIIDRLQAHGLIS